MEKKDKNQDHPEVKDLKNICHVTPNADSTTDICKPLKKDKSMSSKASRKKKP